MEPAIHLHPLRCRAVLDLPRGRSVAVPVLCLLLERSNVHVGLVREAIQEATVVADHDRILVIADIHTLGRPVRAAYVPAAISATVEAEEHLGHLVPPATAGAQPVELGPGTQVGVDGIVRATRDGQVVNAGDRLEVTITVPVRQIDPLVVVAEDASQAWLELEAGECVDRARAVTALSGAMVVHGMDEYALDAATEPAGRFRRVVVARATAVVGGRSAVVEYPLEVAPVANAAGHVDFHEFRHFHEVAAGTALARVIPAILGRDGRDVLGRTLQAPKVTVIEAGKLTGPGTRVTEADPHVVVATDDGVCQKLHDGKIEVTTLMEVKGDVDMHVGNISTRFAVVVRGDIKQGFTAKCLGTLAVGGSIEDARISARGDLTVAGGILPGTQRVKSQADIACRHLQGRQVKCRHLMVKGPIIQGNVLATGNVTAKAIIGGQVICGGSLTAGELGEPGGVRTVVQVGINPYERNLVERARSDHVTSEKELVELKDRLRYLAHHLETATPGQEHDDVHAKLHHAMAAFRDASQVHAAAAAILAMQARYERDAEELARLAVITIAEAAYPGVEIWFGQKHLMTVTSILAHCTVRLLDGQIVSQ